MRDNNELSYATARLTGYLLGMLRVGEVPPHMREGLTELVADVRRANGMADEQPATESAR